MTRSPPTSILLNNPLPNPCPRTNSGAPNPTHLPKSPFGCLQVSLGQCSGRRVGLGRAPTRECAHVEVDMIVHKPAEVRFLARFEPRALLCRALPRGVASVEVQAISPKEVGDDACHGLPKNLTDSEYGVEVFKFRMVPSTDRLFEFGWRVEFEFGAGFEFRSRVGDHGVDHGP